MSLHVLNPLNLGALKPLDYKLLKPLTVSDLLRTLNLVIDPGFPSALETPSIYTFISRYILPLKPLDFGTLYPLKALVHMWGSLYPLSNRLALHPLSSIGTLGILRPLKTMRPCDP